jgi:hypothetical protein
LRSLDGATPEQRAAIYGETMDLRLTLDPHSGSVEMRHAPRVLRIGVGGAFTSPSTPTMLKGKVQLKAA